MVLSIRARRGRPRTDRYRLDPRFVAHLVDSGKPGWMLAMLGGFPHYSHFGPAVQSGCIAATNTTVTRFYRLADALGFPRQDVFQSGRLS